MNRRSCFVQELFNRCGSNSPQLAAGLFILRYTLMAKLTTKQRKALPKGEFAGPGPGKSYPVNDRAHAANAKARASQAVNAGRMSKSQEAKIDAKANKVLKKGKK